MLSFEFSKSISDKDARERREGGDYNKKTGMGARSLLVGFGESDGVLEIEPELIVCIVSTLPTVLSKEDNLSK